MTWDTRGLCSKPAGLGTSSLERTSVCLGAGKFSKAPIAAVSAFA